MWGIGALEPDWMEGPTTIRLTLIVVDEQGNYYRFVIDKKDTASLIKSPKDITGYRIGPPKLLCLYTTSPGKYTQKYIEWGRSRGFHNNPTCRSRLPWYKLLDLKPTNILLPKNFRSRFFAGLSPEPILCDAALYAAYPKCNKTTFWLYVNSTLFFLTLEIYGMRMGGGVLQILENMYEKMPVPNLGALNIQFPAQKLAGRSPLPYDEEIKQPDRRELDKAVLRALGFPEHELDRLVDELHKAFVWLVKDRLMKSNRWKEE